MFAVVHVANIKTSSGPLTFPSSDGDTLVKSSINIPAKSLTGVSLLFCYATFKIDPFLSQHLFHLKVVLSLPELEVDF